ncbi:MAG TPA: lipid-A-disaccharide synthase N-terminal domain-containing protein [Xanthobacteraceae bacterium]|nr:lipid-A-disaccharide synthase N-terminal domain-containing protein [Xanthobacteraceae bacterium]
MLTDIIQQLGDYLYDVFVLRFDGWAALGFLAQALFSARFLVQWIASERAGRSIIPAAFWWFSIAGGFLLFVYSLYRKDPVFIAGQGLGLFIYVRNVVFVLREQRHRSPPLGPSPSTP